MKKSSAFKIKNKKRKRKTSVPVGTPESPALLP
jgi:hypothetical protein